LIEKKEEGGKEGRSFLGERTFLDHSKITEKKGGKGTFRPTSLEEEKRRSSKLGGNGEVPL